MNEKILCNVYVSINVNIIHIFNLNRNILNKIFKSCVNIDLTSDDPKYHSSYISNLNYRSFYVYIKLNNKIHTYIFFNFLLNN